MQGARVSAIRVDARGGTQSAREAITAGPAMRQFHQGDKLIFAYSIYNAAAHLPQLTTQTRIFRDGKLLLTGELAPRWHWGFNFSFETATAGIRDREYELTGGVSHVT